jgi:hypothetical protein
MATSDRANLTHGTSFVARDCGWSLSGEHCTYDQPPDPSVSNGFAFPAAKVTTPVPVSVCGPSPPFWKASGSLFGT